MALLKEKFREETRSVPTKEHMKVAEEEENSEERSLEVSTRYLFLAVVLGASHPRAMPQRVDSTQMSCRGCSLRTLSPRPTDGRPSQRHRTRICTCQSEMASNKPLGLRNSREEPRSSLRGFRDPKKPKPGCLDEPEPIDLSALHLDSVTSRAAGMSRRKQSNPRQIKRKFPFCLAVPARLAEPVSPNIAAVSDQSSTTATHLLPVTVHARSCSRPQLF
ncbi:unnamed protein product [Tetraodon nigroviridis]|uniref:(spotted green pufferfish) hypothetical protein n=1 Tax=Tetraodon nigroviridis TaxID=99883 RepID=Q4SMR5_TETNG|nr:unnamed protein product [Tetraodon nigroviridis]